MLPVAAATPLPAAAPGALFVPALAGAATIVGLLLAYTGYTIGAVGVVSTIASTEGAIAAVISVVAGQQLAPGSGPLLGLVAIGVVLAASGGGREIEEGVRIGRERSLRAAGLAARAALMFGTSLYLIGLDERLAADRLDPAAGSGAWHRSSSASRSSWPGGRT